MKKTLNKVVNIFGSVMHNVDTALKEIPIHKPLHFPDPHKLSQSQPKMAA